jgi:plastocyanin
MPDRLKIGTRDALFILTVHYGNMTSYAHLLFSTVCAVLIILACTAAGCSSSPAPSSASAQPAAPGGNTISIKNFAFEPSTLTVKTGTTVTWVNNDGASHTIVSDTGSTASFSSDPFATGASYTFTFTQPGTYPYHCSIHPTMKGEIIVQ